MVTRDTSLPEVVILEEGESARPLAITLDALLQWISPIAVRGNPEDEFAGVFSQALKYMLLPQENFFDLGDFLMFAQMEWSCKELPADDIEACIRYIKTNAPGLDVSNPLDREKIAHEVTKFFADPGRKYKGELQKLEIKIGSVHGQLKGKDNKIQMMERQLLKKSAFLRLIGVFLFFVGGEAAVVYLAWKNAAGTTLFQKVINSWPLLGIVGAISLCLSYFILGKERIHALGWSFSKLLKMEQNSIDTPPEGERKQTAV